MRPRGHNELRDHEPVEPAQPSFPSVLEPEPKRNRPSFRPNEAAIRRTDPNKRIGEQK